MKLIIFRVRTYGFLLNVWALLNMLQKLRVKAMMAERERQFRAGERSKEEHYAKTPTLDAY